MFRLIPLLAATALTVAGCGAPPSEYTGPTFGQTGIKGATTTTARPQDVGFSVAPPNAPSGSTVDNFAISFLSSLQARSFAGQREYCGYIVLDGAGRLAATPPRAGSFAGCVMPEPRAGQGVIASYHTHGSYDPRYDNEVPSVTDLRADFSYGIDGYVSTPGGRVWLVDFQTRTTRQICGLGCVISDPNFRPQDEAGIRASYTLPTLQQRANGI